MNIFHERQRELREVHGERRARLIEKLRELHILEPIEPNDPGKFALFIAALDEYDAEVSNG